MPPMPPTTVVNCKKCGVQLLDPNMKFCSSCGSEQNANSQWNVSAPTSDVSVVRDRIKAPSIALIVSGGIALVYCFIFLIYVVGIMPVTDQVTSGLQRVMPIVSIVQFAAFGCSVYGAIQMMSLNKYGFAMTSAIIITAAPIIVFGCLGVLITPIGIWALVLLLKPEIKAAFAGNSGATA